MSGSSPHSSIANESSRTAQSVHPYYSTHKYGILTAEIPDALFRRAKQHCSKHGIAFRTLIETGLRTALDPPKPATPFRLKPFGFQGDGPLSHDWPTIIELAYEGRGGKTDQRP